MGYCTTRNTGRKWWRREQGREPFHQDLSGQKTLLNQMEKLSMDMSLTMLRCLLILNQVATFCLSAGIAKSLSRFGMFVPTLILFENTRNFCYSFIFDVFFYFFKFSVQIN